MTWIDFVLPIVLAFITSGGAVAFLKYWGGKPESFARARQANVTSELTLADGWKQYAERLEKRLQEMERKFDRAIAVKDEEIQRLKTHVDNLETELEKYRRVAVKTAEAVKTLDDKMNP